MNQLAEVRQFKDRVEEGLRDASREVSRVDVKVRRLVRAKPLGMALAAMAVGFVLGRLLSRR
jgi:ElaB/YqjD/DUF883 family membrane-anchored ribosome-binding protein